MRKNDCLSLNPTPNGDSLFLKDDKSENTRTFAWG